MKASSADIKETSGSGSGEMNESWSEAVVAHHNGKLNDNITSNSSSAPSNEKDDEAREAPSGDSDNNENEEKKTETLTVDVGSMSINDSPSKDTSSIDLSSNKNSPFRQSLDEEAKAKDRQRSLEAERLANSKQLLRESMNSLSKAVDVHGESVLTRPERNFLEMLLEANGPGAGEACMAAHQRLMDGNLFWTMCGGAAGEVHSMIPGHGWTAAAKEGSVHSSLGSLAKEGEGHSNRGSVNDGDAWVTDWVARGSQDSKGSQEKNEEVKTKVKEQDGNSALEKSEPVKASAGTAAMRAHSSNPSIGSISSHTKELLRPYALPRQSSEARLSRLELRRKQSSVGKDNNRLFRAHEAGLVVTQQGSARRSLQRMGLPMEKGMFAAPPPPSMPSLSKSTNAGQGEDAVAKDTEQQDPNVKVLSDNLTDTQTNTIERTTFEKALAKMDERTIRRIEREERAKQKKEMNDNLSVAAPSTAVFNTGGCISPFSMNILRGLFASRQFSFHRSSSSCYSRFDSFLNTATPSDVLSESTAITASMTDSDEKNQQEEDIFRPAPRPSTSEERLKNLLINAGFKDEDDDDEGLVVDAPTEDDLLSVKSGNTVAMLMKGGPSYRDVNMFRGEAPDETEDDLENTPKTVNTKKSGPMVEKANLKSETTIGSLVSSLGSKSAPSSPESIENSVKESPSDEEQGKKVSPANSDIGELPSLPPRNSSAILSQSERSARIKLGHKRSSTTSIMKSSSSTNNVDSSSRSRRGGFKRSVSWSQMVFAKEEGKAQEAILMSRQDSTSSIASSIGLSVISFPHLHRAAPIRSDSVGSNASGIFSIPPLLHGVPLRSESIVSVASTLSHAPSLSRAHPVYSPRPSFGMSPPPMLLRAHSVHSVRSASQRTIDTTNLTQDEDDNSLNSVDYVDAKPRNGAAWESPLVSKRPPFPRNTSSTSNTAAVEREHSVLLRQASRNDYEGIGIEIESSPHIDESIENARKYKSMVSNSDSVRSLVRNTNNNNSSIWRNGAPMALDDSFIVKTIDFDRHSSEILRSLSNEDLYSSHNLQTINGASSKGSKANDQSSVARVGGCGSESWDLDSGVGSNSFGGNAANAWNVLEDEYAEGYGAQNTLPFRILGTAADDKDCHPHVLSPPLMESLQNFFPPAISETNFWLKYSLVRDGASLPSLLRNIRGTKHTLIAIETVEGEVFGSFTSSPWRKNWNYYGNGESFLWRMRRTRSEKDVQYSVLDQAKLESELDVFYWTGRNELVQYCTHDMIAIGGGTFQDDVRDDVTAADEQRDLPPQNQAFSKADKGGFGLAIDSDLLRGTSSPCATFQSPPLSRAHANGSPFEILNIEVWTMTPCNSVAEAETLEMKTLFLEAYSRES